MGRWRCSIVARQVALLCQQPDDVGKLGRRHSVQTVDQQLGEDNAAMIFDGRRGLVAHCGVGVVDQPIGNDPKLICGGRATVCHSPQGGATDGWARISRSDRLGRSIFLPLLRQGDEDGLGRTRRKLSQQDRHVLRPRQTVQTYHQLGIGRAVRFHLSESEEDFDNTGFAGLE
ncbi:MAG TPA: hypothetical protein VF595_11880 [Tepidisphaeraceae bacterium]